MTEEHAAPALTEEQIDRLLQAMADSFAQQLRAPILHSPDEHGLDYEDVTFPALDGVPLEGWFIPAAGSNKLIVANHPMGFSRAGIPAHLEPWRSIWAPSGNGFEVNLVPDYKILHDAGYHVLAYDLRNFGHSGAANGGIASSGIFEARDVAGLEDAAGGDAAVRRAAVTEVAQVVGQHAVPGVMQDLVVRDEVDLDVVAAQGPYRPPRLQVRGYPGPAESHGVVGDDQLV